MLGHQVRVGPADGFAQRRGEGGADLLGEQPGVLLIGRLADQRLDLEEPAEVVDLVEVDADGWWLVPASGVQLHPEGFETTALSCGPGADSDCEALEEAPASGWVTRDVGLFPGLTYAIRYPSGSGYRYGAIRVTMQGFDQNGNALMVFGWVHQLQVGNRNLSPQPIMTADFAISRSSHFR